MRSLRWVGLSAVAAVVVLVVVGFVLGGYLDAGGTAVPGLHWFTALPRPIRVILEILVVAPIALGVVLYSVTQLAELLWTISGPIRHMRSTRARR